MEQRCHDTSPALSSTSASASRQADKVCMDEVGEELVRDLVLEYCIVNGNKKAAECFALESGAQPGCGLENIDCRVRISELIAAGAIREAVATLNEVDADILKNDASLDFALRMQQFIETLRGSGSLEALQFARSELCSFASQGEGFAQEIKRSLSLLLFASSGGAYPETLVGYFDTERRAGLAGEVNKAVLKSFSHGTESKIVQILRVLQLKQVEVGSKLPEYVRLDGLADS
jgi:hypothetical protein